MDYFDGWPCFEIGVFAICTDIKSSHVATHADPDPDLFEIAKYSKPMARIYPHGVHFFSKNNH